MPTNRHRYMIVLDEETNTILNKIMIALKTKQKSKAIKFVIEQYKKGIDELIEELKEINK